MSFLHQLTPPFLVRRLSASALRRTRQLTRNGQWNLAEKILTRASNRDPLNARLRFRLAGLHLRRRRWSQAREGFRQLPESYLPLLRRMHQRLFNAGQRALDRQAFTEAADLYRSALTLPPAGRKTYQRLAACLTALEHWNEALQLLDEAIHWFPKEGEFPARKGTILQARGDMDGAIRAFAEAIAKTKIQPRWLLWYAGALAAAGRPEEAARTCEQMDHRLFNPREGKRLAALYWAQAGELEQARRILDNLADDQADASVWLELAGLRLQLQDYAGAREAAREALDRDPGQMKACSLAGTAALRMERYPEAIALFQRVLDNLPFDINARMRMAEAHAGLGDTERGRQLAEAFLEEGPFDPDVVQQVGLFYARIQDIHRARNLFERLLTLRPDAESFTLVGEFRNRTGEPEAALPALQKALYLDPEYVAAISQMGITLTALRRFNDAEQSLRRALSEDARDRRVLLALIEVFLNTDRDQEALEAARSLARSAPDFARAHAVNGQTALRCHLPREAVSAFEAALRLTPGNRLWQARLAEACIAAEQVDRAYGLIDVLEEDLEAEPDIGPTLISLLIRLSNYPRALKLARRLVGLRDTAESWNLMADAAWRYRDLDLARQALGQALQRDPEDARTQATLASLLDYRQEWNEAAARYSRALELDPTRYRWRVAQAECHFRLGRTEVAAFALEAVLRDRPDDPTVREKYGRVLLALGRPEAAKRYITAAPQSPAEAHIAFTAYLDSGYDDRAFAYLETQASRLLAAAGESEAETGATGDPDLSE
ncbi:MAG: tetratricopeptide repeat protein [Opitutales bacterium]